jgi:type II secretory pathway pseudopilin PulG
VTEDVVLANGRALRSPGVGADGRVLATAQAPPAVAELVADLDRRLKTLPPAMAVLRAEPGTLSYDSLASIESGALPGMAAAVLVPGVKSALEKSQAKRTLADLRALAQALEAYKTAHGGYPEAADGIQLGPLLGVEAAPQRDAWGTPFYYRTAPRKGYVLASAGTDRELDEDWGRCLVDACTAEQHPPALGLGQDLVLVNGKLVAAPIPDRE